MTTRSLAVTTGIDPGFELSRLLVSFVFSFCLADFMRSCCLKMYRGTWRCRAILLICGCVLNFCFKASLYLNASFSRGWSCKRIFNFDSQSVVKNRAYRSKFLRCVCLPYSDVHFVGPTEDVFVIKAPADCGHVLLSFRVINFSWIRFLNFIDSDGFVVASRHKLSASRRILNARYSGYVVLVNLFGMF